MRYKLLYINTKGLSERHLYHGISNGQLLPQRIEAFGDGHWSLRRNSPRLYILLDSNNDLVPGLNLVAIPESDPLFNIDIGATMIGLDGIEAFKTIVLNIYTQALNEI